MNWPAIEYYLKRDPLRHLVHLKYLHLYREQLDSHYVEADGDVGVLLHHAPAMTFWDTQAYPQAERVLLPTASSQAMAERLADYADTQLAGRLVMKFCDGPTREAFAARFPLKPARTLISLTTTHAPTRPPHVQMWRTATPPLRELFRHNGYTDDEITHYFDEGARAFAIFEGDIPVAACMVFRNFGDVWETAGVHTVSQARRRGYARQVVQAALTELVEQGLTPRYQTELTNTASLGLAESLGMQVCLRFEHFTVG